MAVKKGGFKTGGEGNKGKVTRTSKATAFDSDRMGAKSGGRASRKFGSPKNGEKSMKKNTKVFQNYLKKFK